MRLVTLNPKSFTEINKCLPRKNSQLNNNAIVGKLVENVVAMMTTGLSLFLRTLVTTHMVRDVIEHKKPLEVNL